MSALVWGMIIVLGLLVPSGVLGLLLGRAAQRGKQQFDWAKKDWCLPQSPTKGLDGTNPS